MIWLYPSLALLLIVAAVFLRRRNHRRASAVAPAAEQRSTTQPVSEIEVEETSEFEEPPGWAAMFSTPEWTRFMQEIRSTLTTRQIPFAVEDSGQIRATINSTEQRFGLMNLAQTCRQIKSDEWPGVIQRHFDSLLKSEKDFKEIEKKLGDYAQVKPMLVVRIAPEGMIPQELLVSRKDLPGTVSYLALDLPTSIHPLRPDQTAPWGIPEADLFEAALENVTRLAKPELSKPELEPGVHCTALVGESFFIATHALMLDLYPDCLGAHGSLVAVPHRHCVLAYPIEDLSVIKAIPRLALIGRKLEAEGPGSISSQLYWYHHGTFIQLPYEIKDNTFNFAPPEDFVAVLNELSE